jgi:hypothetical protein
MARSGASGSSADGQSLWLRTEPPSRLPNAPRARAIRRGPESADLSRAPAILPAEATRRTPGEDTSRYVGDATPETSALGSPVRGDVERPLRSGRHWSADTGPGGRILGQAPLDAATAPGPSRDALAPSPTRSVAAYPTSALDMAPVARQAFATSPAPRSSVGFPGTAAAVPSLTHAWAPGSGRPMRAAGWERFSLRPWTPITFPGGDSVMPARPLFPRGPEAVHARAAPALEAQRREDSPMRMGRVWTRDALKAGTAALAPGSESWLVGRLGQEHQHPRDSSEHRSLVPAMHYVALGSRGADRTGLPRQETRILTEKKRASATDSWRPDRGGAAPAPVLKAAASRHYQASATAAGEESHVSDEPRAPEATFPDLDRLASHVYGRIKRQLSIDRERRGFLR